MFFDGVRFEVSGLLDFSCRLSRCKIAGRVIKRAHRVYTTALYKPTKCQNVRGGGPGRDWAGVSCGELTVSKRCQFWVTMGRWSAREYLVEGFDREKAAQFVEWLREKLPQRSGSVSPMVS